MDLVIILSGTPHSRRSAASLVKIIKTFKLLMKIGVGPNIHFTVILNQTNEHIHELIEKKKSLLSTNGQCIL